MDALSFDMQAFKKARNLGLGDLDFSAVHQTVKGGEL